MKIEISGKRDYRDEIEECEGLTASDKSRLRSMVAASLTGRDMCPSISLDELKALQAKVESIYFKKTDQTYRLIRNQSGQLQLEEIGRKVPAH